MTNKHLPMKVLVGKFGRPRGLKKRFFLTMLTQASAPPLKSHVYCPLHFNTSCLMVAGKSKVAEFWPINVLVLPINEAQRRVSSIWGAGYQGWCTRIGILASQPSLHNLINPPWLIFPMVMIQSFPSQYFKLWKGLYSGASRIWNWMSDVQSWRQ